MFRMRTFSLGTLFLFAFIAPVGAEDEEVIEFENFSPSARAAIDELLSRTDKLKRYSDQAVAKVETGSTMTFMPEQRASFAFAKPKRFRLQTDQRELFSDGKELTVYSKAMRRFTTQPLPEDIEKQIRRYRGFFGTQMRIANILFAKNPREPIAGFVKNLTVTGREDIDGERCLRLEGMSKTKEFTPFGTSDDENPVTIWLRASDHLIRRVEVDMSESMRKRAEENEGTWGQQFGEYRHVYDVKDIRTGDEVDNDLFVFQPPAGAKKVDRFYDNMGVPPETAVQFEWSGKDAAEFDLQTADGRWLSAKSLDGKVVVMQFVRSFRGLPVQMLKPLGDLAEAYDDKPVEIICVYLSSDSEKLVEQIRDAGMNLTVLLDPDRELADQYFEEHWSSGIVLISADGIVQGKYPWLFAEQTQQSLHDDIDKLLEGESLSSAVKMTEEQVEEAQHQRGARYSGNSADPLNEEQLVESWSVNTPSGRFTIRGGSAVQRDDSGLWIRRKDGVCRVTYDGRVDVEIPLPKTPSATPFSGSERFIIARVGSRIGVVMLTTVPGDEERRGWRPPKAALITAYDASGDQVWQFEVQVANRQVPQQIAVGDLNGRGGDETVFFHQGAIWILDPQGELVVRKPCPGWPQWMVVEDRDRDRRAEIYIRTNTKLSRYDYRESR